MGIVLILCAPSSGAPKALRALGPVMCVLGVAPQFLGLERARAMLEWEAKQTALLRAGAVVALATGGFWRLRLQGHRSKNGAK